MQKCVASVVADNGSIGWSECSSDHLQKPRQRHRSAAETAINDAWHIIAFTDQVDRGHDVVFSGTECRVNAFAFLVIHGPVDVDGANSVAAVSIDQVATMLPRVGKHDARLPCCQLQVMLDHVTDKARGIHDILGVLVRPHACHVGYRRRIVIVF